MEIFAKVNTVRKAQWAVEKVKKKKVERPEAHDKRKTLLSQPVAARMRGVGGQSAGV